MKRRIRLATNISQVFEIFLILSILSLFLFIIFVVVVFSTVEPQFIICVYFVPPFSLFGRKFHFVFQDGGKFGDMFLHALRTSSMICLGLYRFRDSHKIQVGIPSSKRYVICSPPYHFELQQTDLVFVLAHSDPQLEKFKS